MYAFLNNLTFFLSLPPLYSYLFNLRPRVRFMYFYFFFFFTQPVPPLTLHLKSIHSASASLFAQDGTEKLILKGKRRKKKKPFSSSPYFAFFIRSSPLLVPLFTIEYPCALFRVNFGFNQDVKNPLCRRRQTFLV